MDKSASIVGAGSGISASSARLLAADGHAVALASRSAAARADGVPAALRLACDATDPAAVAALFARLEAAPPPLEVVLYNAGHRARGVFLVAQHAARRMLARGRGTLLFTGASASVKGYA